MPSSDSLDNLTGGNSSFEGSDNVTTEEAENTAITYAVAL